MALSKPKPPIRIVSNPEILAGTPVIEGTRVPAENVLVELQAGTDRFEIFGNYPSLPPDAIDVCIAWARSGRSL